MEISHKFTYEPNTRRIILRYDRRVAVLLALYLVVLVSLATTIVLAMERTVVSDTTYFVDKSSLKNTLVAIIKNNGDLNAVKHTFSERLRVKRLFLRQKEFEMYYSYNASLSVVLNDLKCDYLSADPFVQDSLYFSNLVLLIQENDYHNPFDNLESNQKYYFENIRTKAGAGYDDMQSDVSKIADELQHKNQLVDKYLNKTTLSFVISLIALVISLVASVIQIVQNGRTGKLVNKLIEKESN